ncbi:MAG TPA: hypothetical protein VGH19_18315 [Verrucomicrobiae bacterium]
MPKGDAYVSRLLPVGISKADIRLRVITPVEAVTLERALLEDAVDLYYSAWVSFMDALRGIQSECGTWATVKLYYSAFYTLRSALALGKICAFHVGHSSFSVKAIAGQTPSSCTDRGTHKSVLNTFNREYPGHALVSQQIDLQNALDWLVDKREAANYQQARFSEPEFSPEFDFVNRQGLRKTLGTYLSDTSLLYVFDPDHAIVAYPLRALQMIGDQMLAAAIPMALSPEEESFLKSKASDKVGNLTALVSEMKRLRLLS